MKSKIIISLFYIILFIGLTSAACTINLDKENYTGSETATATMSCDLGSEKNEAYTVVWNNGTAVIETDTGTTPNVVSQAFFETLEIPSGQDWSSANVTLNLTSLEDFDTFTVNSSASLTSLVVTNITFTSASELFIGKILGIRALVKDGNGKKISNADCQFDLEDGTNLPIISSTDRSHDGVSQTDFIMDIDYFDENREYIARVGCFCGASGTENACVDEDGGAITNSIGSATNFFTTLSWIDVNTVTSLSGGTVDVGEEFSICANVSNLLADKRLDLKIFYNWRCGSGLDSDTDRIVYGEYSQLRGISTNTTQMQCHDFIVPNEEHIEKGSNMCYGATDVSILNEASESLVTYSTTSSQFNVTINSIHPNTDFQRVSQNKYHANVSFNDFDVGIKNVHVILDGDLNGEETSLTSIENYTLTYFNNTPLPYDTRIFFHDHAIRFQENLIRKDAIEIEIANVNTTMDENFNLTITFDNYAERQADALEGIENKTGTFHLDVNCPASAALGSEMNCSITGYVEDSQTVEKEVDFTCFITDGTNNFSSVNFNQMLNRTSLTLYRTFLVPTTFSNGNQYVLQCYADYYNFGSRRDSFYDTFYAGYVPSGGSSDSSDNPRNSGGFITGNAVDEDGNPIDEGKDFGDIINEFNPLSPERNWAFIAIEIIVLLGVITLISSLLIKSKKSSKEKFHNNVIKFSSYAIAIILIGLIIFGLVKLYNYLRGNSFFMDSLIQDVFFRDLILAGFIVLLGIIVFKALNIRGEIRFGSEGLSKRYYYDKKISKLQSRLNRQVLKDELRKHKRK